jgi:CRP-like cAMP-binding protein
VAPLERFFERNGTLVRLARHQQIKLDASARCSYLLRAGAVALETAVPLRHIAGFAHTGDLIEAASMPSLPQLSLRALTAAELWRLRSHDAELLHEHGEALDAYLQLCAAELRRLLLANVGLARLSAEQRTAAFLLSSAARLGRRSGNRVDIELAASRTDIADHLGLNPDTLSRVMARLQEAGLIESNGRHRLTIRDWQGLCARSPLASAILD